MTNHSSLSSQISVKAFIPCHHYGSICALEHIDISIPRGQLLAIIGPNGGGKSTFLKIISGLEPLVSPASLSLSLTHRHDLAFLPQSTVFDRTFPLLVEDVVQMGLWSKIGLRRSLPREYKDVVPHCLAQVGLAGFEKRSLIALSGGQLQRLLFARIIAQDAQIILLDEPFAAVDSATTADLMGLVCQWHGHGKTVLVVLHDLNLVKTYFPHSLLLAKENLGYGLTADVLTADSLTRAAFHV